ncbi:MAG: site-specific integrase [Lachnospiraceae bacterium]|nr:site-specific integrase [Lachnospiraceae bacterium]
MKEKHTRRKNGMGSIKPLPNGKCQLKQQHGYNRNGNPRILTATGTSENDCRKIMRKKIYEVENAAPNAGNISKKSLTELCYDHLEHHLSRKDMLKPKGADRRESTIRNQIEPYDIGKLPASSVTSNDIEDHIEMLISSTTLSISSIRKALDVINSAYKWAIGRQYLTYNPCTDKVKDLKKRLNKLDERNSSDGVIVVLSDSQCSTLENYVWNAYGNQALYNDILGLSVLFLLYTGIRVGELCALRWSDYSPVTKTLDITKTRNVSKNRSNDTSKSYTPQENPVKNLHSRTIVLSDKAINVLETLRRISPKTEKDDYIMISRCFGPSNPSNYDYVLNKLYKKAGFTAEVSGAHVLRRTFATKLYDEGLRVEKIANYVGDTVPTVIKHYISPTKRLFTDGSVKNAVSLD